MTSPVDIRITHNPQQGDIEASEDALVLMAACINEALEAVGEWEFTIRLGFSVEDARNLKSQIESILAQRGSDSS